VFVVSQVVLIFWQHHHWAFANLIVQVALAPKSLLVPATATVQVQSCPQALGSAIPTARAATRRPRYRLLVAANRTDQNLIAMKFQIESLHHRPESAIQIDRDETMTRLQAFANLIDRAEQTKEERRDSRKQFH
jgi:hypothetical protein